MLIQHMLEQICLNMINGGWYRPQTTHKFTITYPQSVQVATQMEFMIMNFYEFLLPEQNTHVEFSLEYGASLVRQTLPFSG